MRIGSGALMALGAALLGNGAGAQNAGSTGFQDSFDRLDRGAWHVAQYDFSHPHFDTDWRAAQIGLADGLKLNLAPHDGLNPFAGASIRREEPSHFGWYEAELTAARGDGVITGFFLYTGAAYGTQHDEIDWEFFGRDTTTAQVAWWRDGVLRSQKIDLGFDAADGPNTYAFHWQPERIDWYVNGALVFSAQDAIPQTPQRLFANVWAVSPALQAWAGLADPSKSAQASVTQITMRPDAPEAEAAPDS